MLIFVTVRMSRRCRYIFSVEYIHQIIKFEFKLIFLCPAFPDLVLSRIVLWVWQLPALDL